MFVIFFVQICDHSTSGSVGRVLNSVLRIWWPQVMYSQFLQLVKQGSVRSVRMDDSTQRAYFDLLQEGRTIYNVQLHGPGGAAPPKTPVALPAGRVFFTKCIGDPHLIPLLVTAGVEFGAVKVSLVN